MEEKVVKLGVVGLERGRHIVSCVIGEPNVVLHAICDKNPERLASAKEFFEKEKKVENLLCFDSFEEILASDIDAIVIATDATIHTPMVVQALDAGKHVLSEIPTINTVEEAEILKAACNRHPDLKYMAGENCCYWAFITAWKKMYDEGKFGEIIYAESEYLHPVKSLNYDANGNPTWRLSYDAIKYLTHNLGPLLYIMDDRCVSVSCLEPDVVWDPDKTGAENGIALFKTAKGAVIRIFIGFGGYFSFDHNFALYGTKGTIETDKNVMCMDAHSWARLEEIPGSKTKKIEIPVALKYPGEKDDGHGGADTKMMNAFIDCIVNDTKPPVDVDLGIRMSIPGIYAHESALKGGDAVEIPDIQ